MNRFLPRVYRAPRSRNSGLFVGSANYVVDGRLDLCPILRHPLGYNQSGRLAGFCRTKLRFWIEFALGASHDFLDTIRELCPAKLRFEPIVGRSIDQILREIA